MIKQQIYKNRIDVVLEGMNALVEDDRDFINEVKIIPEGSLTKDQKERINKLYIKQ